MERINKILFTTAFLLFFMGDLTTTWYSLSQGGEEANVLLSQTGLGGMILVKALFFCWLYIVIILLEKRGIEQESMRTHDTMSGVVLGAIIMVGVMTIFVNTGFYG